MAAARVLGEMGARRVYLAAARALAPDFAGFELVEAGARRIDAVVLGDLYRGFTWRRLNDLFQTVNRGVPLIALHKNRVCRRSEGLSLDLGPFVAALEYAAGVEARVVAKPSGPFFDLALASLGLPPEDVIMVGDDIEADIGGAKAARLGTVQVMTGKYQVKDDRHPTIAPDGRIGSIADLPRWIG
jgi:HAD superfamily hydrolase (TIGR01458 family)